MFRKHVFLVLSMGLCLAAPMAWAGGIVADQGGPGVRTLGGGTDVVDIKAPNAKGLSHNQYTRFDIDKSGAVLNNSVNGADTTLAGEIAGNPNLKGGAARVILNEVNTDKASQLNGFLEVGGQRAEVVVANPAGVTCDGCGFINAQSGVLGAGAPVIGSDGAYGGLKASAGKVIIGEGGLMGADNDYTGIVAAGVEVLSTLQGGRNLNVETNGAGPALALDVKALGGMYADRIKLVGNQNGLGVRNAGAIEAGVGDLVVTNQGTLENSGVMRSANGKTDIKVAGDLTNSGNIDGRLGAKVSAKGTVKNAGDGSDPWNKGIIQAASGLLKVESLEGGIENAASSRIISSGELDVSAKTSVKNNGQMEATKKLQVTAGSGDLVNGAAASIVGGGPVILTVGGSFKNDAYVKERHPVLSQEYDDSYGRVESLGDMTINAGGSLSNNGRLISSGKLTANGGMLTNYGVMESTRNMSLVSGGTLNNHGRIISSGESVMTAGGDINNKSTGVMEAFLSLKLTSGNGGLINNGRIVTSDAAVLKAQKDQVNGLTGILEATKAIRAESVAGSLLNRGRLATRATLETKAPGEIKNEGRIYTADPLPAPAGAPTGE